MSIFYCCRICDIFDQMLDRASELPETTAELVELQNYLNECRDVTMCNLKEKIQTAAENVLFLMQHALLSCKRYFVVDPVLNEVTICYYHINGQHVAPFLVHCQNQIPLTLPLIGSSIHTTHRPPLLCKSMLPTPDFIVWITLRPWWWDTQAVLKCWSLT